MKLFRLVYLGGLLLGAAACPQHGALAGTTDIANAPLFTSVTSLVKPNIMFVLDNSGSMAWNYLPDDANLQGKYGIASSQCNGLAYNPSTSTGPAYLPPVDATGASLPNASTDFLRGADASQGGQQNSLNLYGASRQPAGTSITVTLNDNYNSSTFWNGHVVTVYDADNPNNYMVGYVTSWDVGRGRLTIKIADNSGPSGSYSTPVVASGPPDPNQLYFSYTGSQPLLGWSYPNNQLDTTTTFYQECNSNVGSSPGVKVFTEVVVTPNSPDAQRYANWLAYYSTRIQMMKTAVTQAFKGLDSNFRVGYTTIDDTSVNESDTFMDVRDFDANQKGTFYAKFNAARAGGSTPLRGALAKVGQYFAKKAGGASQTYDPVQYSCQRNFTILSTDGYWNTDSETRRYGPLQLDNRTQVGEQDGAGTPRPQFDGATGRRNPGSSNSLADVAMYYYKTDLRNSSLGNCTGALGTDVCADVVPANGQDTANWQHMTTFTLALGNSGTLKYDPNYQQQTVGDYADIVNGVKNWPIPSSDAGPVNIDDLWHAAVNGRGTYFSATNPQTLAKSLASALNTIKAQVGTSSAAATSTLQPVAGNNGVYIAQFRSSEWTGDLRAYTIDPTTGAVTTQVVDGNGNTIDQAVWSAGDKLTTSTQRNIYYFKPGTTGNTGSLQPFSFATMNSADQGLFSNVCNKSPTLTQCSGVTGDALNALNSGANMVSFLSGQPQSQYRTPTRILGDIVNSSPVFVGAPVLSYTENGYANFQLANKNRASTLYVGANDGMLHAFDASTGQERWAYIPRLVMPNLYKLADSYYQSKHQYYVDATPSVQDVYFNNAWHTILVGGLNAGGNGYYALDVTDPSNPQALWEFTNANMGLSFGNPIITKRADGTWIVAVASGYNNADGKGHLFILNAATGALLLDIATSEGSPASPSGLAKLNVWVDSSLENTAKRFYGGDLQGNVWRFDVDNLVAPKQAAFKLAQLVVNNVPQPITQAPQLATVTFNKTAYPVVYVGTGEYLGSSDIGSTQQQSLYAIKDTLSSTGLGDVRAGKTLIQQPVTTTSPRIVGSASTLVDWSVNNGWFVDLISSGERVVTNMSLAFNVLTVAANVPGSGATDCTPAGKGTAWLYQFNIATGAASTTALGTMVAGISPVKLSDGSGALIITLSDASTPVTPRIDVSKLSLGKGQRSGWRELVN